ncbi:hypothetical protein Ddc_11674 [Ditylenchus destructor]|nr:hypothetical protein Ddc_11674 [Ditylenchus destructor]
MSIFLHRTGAGKIKQLDVSRELSPNIVVIISILTLAVVIGHGYTNVFNLVFVDCDELTESRNGAGLFVDFLQNLAVPAYSCVMFIYILRLRLYEIPETRMMNAFGKLINSSIIILWAKNILYKSYMVQPDILRKIRQSMSNETSLLASVFPCIKNPPAYACDSHTYLNGTRQTWHEIDKHLFHPITVSANCEYFAVIFITHLILRSSPQAKESDFEPTEQRKSAAVCMPVWRKRTMKYLAAAALVLAVFYWHCQLMKTMGAKIIGFRTFICLIYATNLINMLFFGMVSFE